MLAALKAQRAANEELRELSRAKSDFVATVSHEFRSALAGIRAYSELMVEIDLSAEEVRSYANRITEDADSLGNLITDLLDLDQVESGQMKLHIRPLDLNHLIQDMVEIARQKTNHHTFYTRLDATLAFIPGDIDKLNIALSNLLDNAIKYSPEGGPIILTTRAEEHVAHITIQDPGIGIPGKDLERIFERFARAEREATRYIWGTGLGLPITQQIVHLHSGRIWAESVKGQGSTFHVTLPLSSVTTEHPDLAYATA